MLPVAGIMEWSSGLSMPGPATCISLIGYAVLSTALAYVVFFQILVRSGATNVMFVTLLVPLTAISLGHYVLGESLKGHEVLGALVIGSALLTINGRVSARSKSIRKSKPIT